MMDVNKLTYLDLESSRLIEASEYSFSSSSETFVNDLDWNKDSVIDNK